MEYNNLSDIEILKSLGAIKEGHFILSSGLHSANYIQCAAVFEQTVAAAELCARLIAKIKENIDVDSIDAVVAPAMGGVLIGYEIARQLKKKTIFCERVNGEFAFRRGFNLEKGQKVLVVEDVITTGKSSLETYKAIENEFSATVIAETCLILRDKNIKTLNNVPIIPLLNIEFPTYKEEELPSELTKIPVTKPGSRFLK